ncbi:hypothetical protein ACFWIA_24815 [Streptomyces sp. NPDC127068]|uniref:hypothetical protein n=1 Tax=Streptomyces sp. NPDC127068 TaxID=3347127 RepID=UPI00364B7A83
MTSAHPLRSRRTPRVLAVLALALGVTAAATGCSSGGGGGPREPDTDALNTFLTSYVSELNARDAEGLAKLLGPPHGEQDARARLTEYGGQGWRVTWSHRSELEGVYQVRIKGSARKDRQPVDVREVLVWDEDHWNMAPLGDGTTPPGSSSTKRPAPGTSEGP